MKINPFSRLLTIFLNSLAASSISHTVHATSFDVPAGATQKLGTLLDIGEGLTKTGDGTLAVTVDQFIDDDVVVDAGTLIFYGAADPDANPSSIIVNNGLLMLGGSVFSAPVTLNGGTLRMGAQRTTTITGFGNARGHILGDADSNNASNHFALVSGNYFYSGQRAINQSQPQNVIDLAVPTDGLITSDLKPEVAFQVAVNGVDAANINSNEGNLWRALTLQPADQMRYASLDLLVSSRGDIGGMFVRTRWNDNTTNSTSQSIPSMSNALTSNANTAFSGGVVATDGTTFDPTTLMHMHHYTQHIDPTKVLSAVEFVRIGSSPTGTGLAFAASGLAVNDAPFGSDITVTADSALDLAGAPILNSSATLDAADLILNNSTLTTTRSINNTTAYRTNFSGGVLTGTGTIDIASSTGGGIGTVVFTGPITGSGGLNKIGPGNLGLPATNTYQGITEIDAGTVFLNNASGLGTTDTGTSLFGGTLYLLSGANSAAIAEPFTVEGAATLRSGNGFSYNLTGPMVLNADLTVTLDGGSAITHAGQISGPSSIVKNSGDVLTLSGDNSFGSGALVLGSGTANRGYIRLSHSNALGNHDAVTLAGSQGGISGLQLEGDVSLSQNITTQGRQNATTTGYIMRSLSGNNAWNGNVTINNGGGSYGFVSDTGTLTLGGTITSSYTSTFGARLVTFAGAGNIHVSGPLMNGGNDSPSKNLSVSKDGPGTLTLAGTNDYSGNTAFNDGTTILTGSISNSAIVTIGATAGLDVSSHASPGYAFTSAQTLRGNGTLTGNATISGTVAPGLAVGTLTTDGDLAFAAGSTLIAEIDLLGTAQVETATAAGAAIADGDVTVTVTSEDLGSPAVINVPILNGESSDAWAFKVRAALAADAAISPWFNVGGINNSITLTRLAGAANDAILNIALENGTISPGIVNATTSANTTAGVAPGTDLLAATGQLDVSGATLDLVVTGAPAAPAFVIATYGSLAPGAFAAVNNLPAGYEIDYTYNSGTAIALVESSGSGDFASWASANGVIGGPGGDSDNDGIPNLVEYALDLDFKGPDGSAGIFTGNTMTFTKRQDAIDNGDISWVIETSQTLAPGSWNPAVIQNPGNAESTISHTLPTDQGRIFGRLKVNQP
jgi:autotransporter-associated beta strand protein